MRYVNLVSLNLYIFLEARINNAYSEYKFI